MATLGILIRFASAGAGPVGGVLGGLIGNLNSVQGVAAAAGVALGGFAAAGIAMNAKLETTELQFKTLIGNAAEAKSHVASLFEFAKKTPFETQPIIDASMKLRVFGGAALDTKETLTLLGDAAAATNAPLDELGMWTGRLYAALQAGRPFGEASQRLMELSVLTPQARTKMEDMQKSGASANEIFEVFQGTLGRFNGAMLEQAQTMDGQMSTAMDNLSMTAGQVMLPAFEALKDVLNDFNAALSSEEGQQAIQDAADGLRILMSVVGFLATALKDGLLPPISIVIGVWKDMASTAMDLSATIQDFVGDAILAITGFGDVAESVLEGDFAGAVANAKQLSYDMRNGMFDDHEVIQQATEDTGGSIERMADRAKPAMAEMGDASTAMAMTMTEAYQQVQDSNDLQTEAMKERDRLLLEERKRNFDAGQALAEAASQDNFERITSDLEIEQEIRDKAYEADGKALIKRNEDAAKAQQKAVDDALALEEKANKELLAEQDRAVKEAERITLKAYEDEQAFLNRHKDAIIDLYAKEGEGVVTSLATWLNEGVFTVDAATREINELLGRVPPAVLADLQVFEDFKLGLGNMAPEWAVVLQPVIDAVNAMDEETRKSLGLSADAWQRLADSAVKSANTIINAAHAAFVAQQNAFAASGGKSWQTAANMQWKGEFDWGPGGKLITGTPSAGDVQKSVMQQRAQQAGAGTTVHGDINIYARNDAATEINNLSALVR